MALQIKNDSQTFGPVSGTGPNSTIKTVTLPAPVTQATAILTGFTVEFSHGDDHHLGQLDVQVQVAGSPSATGRETGTTNTTVPSSSPWSGSKLANMIQRGHEQTIPDHTRGPRYPTGARGLSTSG